MTIFDTLMSKIFGSAKSENTEAKIETSQATATPSTTNETPTAVAMAPVDVDMVLTKMAESNKEKLNWKTSIVDLMKLVEMDSSLSSRKELASELSFDGDMNDSANMNIWLHKQVMKKISQNGGILPDDLKN